VAEPAQAPVLVTDRFILRPLTLQDATDRYLSWLREEQVRRYIMSAGSTRTLDDLRAFSAGRIGQRHVLFLGIFERAAGRHIGNIKFEPIDQARGTAEMGILIGEPDWRGRGVASEVVAATACWLRDHCKISRICLGVERENDAALSAYRHAGFRQTGVVRDPRVRGEIVRMTLETGD
jgi:ribosomal-protein-alanine N-acetyltransferase